MRMLTFFRFMRQILRKKPADLDWIQKQGLMAVKLAQIFALRPDLLGEQKCKQLQQLYQHAASIPPEDWETTLKSKAIPNFFDFGFCGRLSCYDCCQSAQLIVAEPTIPISI